MEQLSIVDEVLDHPPPQLLDNGEGMVLGGGGRNVPAEADKYELLFNNSPSAASSDQQIITDTKVSIGAAIDVDTKVIFVFDDIFYCHQYQSTLNSLFVCILAYTIQLFMYNSCCSYTLFYFYLTCLNSSMCNRMTLLTSFIFRCLHNAPVESVRAGSCRKSTELGTGIIVLV